MPQILKLLNSKFVKQVLNLGSGTIVAHLITLAFSPLITRIYTPEEFGVFSLFHSLVVIISLISTGAYEYSIVLPKKNETAKNLFKTALLFSLLFSTFSYFTVWIFHEWISERLLLSIPFLMLLPAAILFHSLMNIYTYWFVRKEYFTQFSYSKVFQSGSTGVVQIATGLLGITGIGLLIGYIAGRIFSVLSMIIQKTKDFKKVISGWNKNPIKKAAQSYADHPKYVLLSSLLSTSAIELPVLLITALFGNEELGYYGLAFKVLMGPVSLVSVSVGHVYFQKFSDRKNKSKPISQFLLKIWAYLIGIAVIPFSIIFLIGETAFTWLFGEQWLISGTIASIMAPMLLLTFVTTPTSKSMLVLDKQKWMPIFSAISLVVRFSALMTGYIYFDFITAIWLLVIGQIVVYLIHSFFIWSWCREFDQKIKI